MNDKVFDRGSLRQLINGEKQCDEETTYNSECELKLVHKIKCLKLKNHIGFHLWFEKDSIVIVWPKLGVENEK